MTVEAQRTSARPEPHSSLDRDAARALALLEDNPDGVTIAAMRERGIETPAQVIYALQLSGYEIERRQIGCPARPRTLAYRLCISSLPLARQPDGPREVRSV
jgi:Helix-turn-helix domain